MGTSIAWRYEGRVYVVVHSVDPPSPVDWAQYVNFVRTHGAGPERRFLVRTRGGAPNGPQRKALNDALDGHPSPVAVMTNSVMARAIGSAVGLFNPDLAVFGVDKLKDAAQHLALTDSEVRRAQELLVELEMEIRLGVQAAERREETS